MHRLRISVVFLLLVVTACVPQQTESAPEPFDLIPFLTSTPAPFQTPEGLVPLTTPLPSPTPFTYTVQPGDSMSVIAERFGVSLDDLQAANPEVSSNAMSVGQVIKIPGDPGNPSGESTPMPAPYTVEQIECYPTTDGGMWCFVLVRNDLTDTLENISAQVTLVGLKDAMLASQTAFLALDILPPGNSLPLAVFFAPDVPFDAQPRVQLLTAIRIPQDDARYIPATIDNALVRINAGGHSAQVSGVVVLQGGLSAASQVWVVATAYDGEGRVAGIRRWESNAGLPAGGSLPFILTVSSVGGRIARVEFAVQARP